MNNLGRVFTLLFVGVLCAGAAPVWAQAIGKVTSVSQGATVTQANATKRLVSKADIREGDLIRTDNSGQVQIVFADRTRIVVGPASELQIEEFTQSAGEKASRFAVQAVGGTFRFLTGRSPKAAYELRTPTATMGIRGTEFDFSVDRSRLTNLVTFSGEVRICTRNNSCARVSGGCAVVTANRARIVQPDTEENKKSLIQENFPFVLSQETLASEYRVRVKSCGEVGKTVTTQTTVPQKSRDRFEGGGDPDARGGDQSQGGDERGGGYDEGADEN